MQIDDSPLLSQSGQGTYQSPVLADGVEHTITYAIGNQSLLPAFDYLTVTAGPSTPMYGRTVIVDDADSVLEYTGGWMTAPPMALPFDYSTSPYLETTHWSNMAGASISFPFTGQFSVLIVLQETKRCNFLPLLGDSIAVYGVIANTVPDSGNVTTTYTVGGKSATLSLPTGSRQPIPMSEMFQTNLTAGQHTLLINITSVSAGQYIGFDFLTYNATFDSISSISSGVPSESATPGTSNSHSKQVGAIAGGVIGGVAFFGVILLLLFLWRRRIRSKPSTSGWLNLGGSDSLSSKLLLVAHTNFADGVIQKGRFLMIRSLSRNCTSIRG